MAAPTWQDLDKEREALPRKLSRARLSRLAGVSESTITKGVKDNTLPIKSVREKVRLALAGQRALAEETAGQLAELGSALERRLAE